MPDYKVGYSFDNFEFEDVLEFNDDTEAVEYITEVAFSHYGDFYQPASDSEVDIRVFKDTRLEAVDYWVEGV